MAILSRYELVCIPGTADFVVDELTDKFSNIEILHKNKSVIQFVSEEKDFNLFANLYSPLKIKDETGNILNLSKREWRKEFVAAGINPSLAYIMCQVANLSDKDIVYDPFCGASVIPITALKYFNIKRAICSDISSKAVYKSKKNFESANIDESKYKLFKSDISDVQLNKQNIDRIISNLPFGIRTGNHKGNIIAYYDLEKLARRLLRKKGLIVVLTQEKTLLREVFRKEFWLVKKVARVNQGGLLPEIFTISKK